MKYEPSVETFAKWESELFVVTEANSAEIKEKLAAILEAEGEFGEHVDPAHIFLRVGALSPFGKENLEVAEKFEKIDNDLQDTWAIVEKTFTRINNCILNG